MAQLQDLILNNLINHQDYAMRVLPHVKAEYFEGAYRDAYSLIIDFVANYNKLPTPEILEIEFGRSPLVNGDTADEVFHIIKSFDTKTDTDRDWLFAETEKWCQDRAVHLGVLSAIDIIAGKNKDATPGMIPDILKEALSVTFDTSVGHDYLGDINDRLAFYKKVENKIPFDIEMLNRITNGGVTRKTLNVVMASCVNPDTKVKIRYRKKRAL